LTSSILASLNPPQLAAVTHGDGPLLVLAGAGSGKTRALTHRFAHLVMERGLRPWEILAITFTNKAAAEMSRRVEGLLGAGARGMWVMTFHAACVRILRRDIERIGYTRNFLIYDETDQRTVMRQVFKDLDFPERKISPAAALSAISRAKSELLAPRHYERQANDWFGDYVAAAYLRYQERLEQQNALDFDDLLGVTARLFREVPDVLEHYRDRFRHILVDEYQDTNHAQYVLVSLLAGGHRNLAVVGDDDQSIYGFRGADLRNILEFEKDYPEAKVVRLEQNYRSTRPILDTANHVIAQNVGRKPKRLWTDREDGERPGLFLSDDERDEADFVAGEIMRLVREEERPFASFAVLYRMNAQSRVLEEAFMRRALPYRIVGGVRFYERKEIKDVLAYLRVIVNPADAVSLERALGVPRRGIGSTTWGRLVEAARGWQVPVYEAMRRVNEVEGIPVRTRLSIAGFVEMLEGLRKEAASLPLRALVERVAETSGVLSELAAEHTTEATGRAENIKELYSVAADFVVTSDDASLEAFLATIALITDLDTVEERGDAALLMTLHNAKGLEFPVVFVVGLEEGIFPHSRSLEEPDAIEEERRLCYVGITRAREKLYLTAAARRTIYGQSGYSPLSRFVREIPDGLVRDLRAEKAGVTDDRRSAADGPVARRRGDNLSADALSGPPVSVGRMGAAASGMAFPRPAGTGVAGASGVVSSLSFGSGDRIVHPKWGQGVVVSVRGKGEEAEITLAFPELGIKKVVARYAGLRRV
jgi:DNA helicase-2/ATP-dependent DNA helicase PcrA